MCRAQKDLVWGALGWVFMFIFGLGCVFVAQGANTGAWLSAYWPHMFWGVGVFSLPLGFIGSYFFWKARPILSPDSRLIPKNIVFVWAITPVVLGVPFLFCLSYIADTSKHGLSLTGERLMFFGMMVAALHLILFLGLSLAWLTLKGKRK